MGYLELARAIVFECAYQYWGKACGWPSRETYGRSYLRKLSTDSA